MELQERPNEALYQIMLARYYSSSLGRFMAVDPGNDSQLEDPQSWNKYAYVGNNPISYVDPDGRFKKKHHREIGRAHGQSRQEARDVANVDNALGGALPCCDAVFRSGTHFPTEEKIQQLLNEAAEAWARGDFETAKKKKDEADHASDDDVAHRDKEGNRISPWGHFWRSLVDALNPFGCRLSPDCEERSDFEDKKKDATDKRKERDEQYEEKKKEKEAKNRATMSGRSGKLVR